MKKKTIFLLLINLFVFSALAIAVFAAEGQPNAVESVIGPFGARFAEVYQNFAPFIDAGLYLIIFLGLTKISLGKLWKGRDAKAIKTLMVGISLVLALSLALFEAQYGFNISTFGPLAAIILIAVLGYALWGGLNELQVGDPMLRAAGAYIVVYYSLLAVVPSAMSWINTNIPILAGILALIGAVFTIYIIIAIIMWIISLFGTADTAKAAAEAREAASKQAEEKSKPAPTTEAGKKKRDAEEKAKKKKKDDEEAKKKARDVTELKAAEGFLIKSREAINSIMSADGAAAFESTVKKWGADWKDNKDIEQSKQNVAYALQVLNNQIAAPYHQAVIEFQNGLKAITAASMKSEYKDIKEELMKIRVEAQAQMDHDKGPLPVVHAAIGYYGKQLQRYLAGEFKAQPTLLVNTVLKGGLKYHISGQFPKQLKSAFNGVNVILQRIEKLLVKLSK